MPSKIQSGTTRRTFCAFGGSALLGLFGPQGLAFELPQLDVASIDRKRILEAADQYLREKPITITAYSSSRSAGGKHDYFSKPITGGLIPRIPMLRTFNVMASAILIILWPIVAL
ncbi:MAG TPA: hypothetical protein VIW67_06220 [Terriglobales bacterium]|jgi:hypothetical protein